MDQLVASAPAAAADVDTRVSITVDPAASPAQPRTVAEAVTETGQALLGLESALGSLRGERAGPRPRGGPGRDGPHRVRPGGPRRDQPAARHPMSPALEAHLDWSAAGPAGAEERWDCYQHDSGTSVTWAWREPPRQNVTSNVLARLLGPGGYPKRVSLQYRPLPAAAAARALDSEVRAAEFRSEYARRTRRDVTARDAHDQARARQAADEEARGAGVSLIGLYVTVTVTDPAQLPRATADTEAAAESSKIRLQRLYRSQAAGFTVTLPCGICLPELARRLPALTGQDRTMSASRIRICPAPARTGPIQLNAAHRD